MKKILRKYLEIKSIENLNEVKKPSENLSVEPLNSNDFQINKFFYKQIGKKYSWIDRLSWDDNKWINYVSNNNIKTYVLKNKGNPVGFFELIFHPDNLEIEIAYFGIFEEFFGKKLGGYLLTEAIKISFEKNPKRVWVHTCSLDHKHALKNYLNRGMKIFKEETINLL